MKTLKEYITESFNKRKYQFKLKIAGEVSEDQEKTIKSLLEKYGVDNFAKNSTTPIQSLPLDFPKLKNIDVSIYDVSLNYPTTPFELREYICSGAKFHADYVVVRNPAEPTEQYQQPVEERKGALLDDPNYKEAGKVKSEEYFGSKFNQNLLKELAKDSKQRAKERGEKVPTEGAKSAPEFDTAPSTSPISGKK